MAQPTQTVMPGTYRRNNSRYLLWIILLLVLGHSVSPLHWSSICNLSETVHLSFGVRSNAHGREPHRLCARVSEEGGEQAL